MAGNAAGSLVQTLGSLLVKEGLLTWGLHRDIEEIKLELQSMQSFLKDADMRQHAQEGLKTWVGQVRNMSYEAEDIMDEYTYFMAKNHKQGLQAAFYNTISIPKKIFYQHRMARKLQDIKSLLKTTKQNRIRYALPGYGETSNEAREEYRMVADYDPEDDLVGIQSNKGLLISWLTNREPKRMAHSVFGMGGLGKTTLVGKAYHSSEVQNDFDCCAWVTVSQRFDITKILQDMIKEFTGSSQLNDFSGKNYRDLVKLLINYLELKRYVLILDDVWSIDAWKSINVALPNNRRGSRIMITTRDEVVALHVAELEAHAFRLQRLNENEAWTLFCQKAFKNTLDGACPDELKSFARSIVNKCDGLPLAIVATAGNLMASKQSVEAWRILDGSFDWVLSNNIFFEREKNVLLLNYYELPIHLKQCFLHLCVFPEDYLFVDVYIIRIWIAEGFVERNGCLSLEDTAMNYINELVRRCMIQFVSQRCTLKVCRVHDVMREIGVSIAKDENFAINLNESEEPQDDRNARRLFLEIDIETDVLQVGTSNLRSYIVHGYGNLIKCFNPRFKLLRVLHLDSALLQEVPNSLGELFNLQYLSLRYSKIRELPNSLKRLRNLRTLNISNSKVEKLPSWIVKFEKLRHLNMSYGGDDGTFGVEGPTGICTLKSLEDLQYVEGNKELLQKIGNLTQLKWLGIESVKEGDGADLCASLQRMKSLLELIINQYREQGPLELEALSSPPPLLQVLMLNGKLETLPHWIVSVKNLRHLSLGNSNLSADPLFPLQDLPNLNILVFMGHMMEINCVFVHHSFLNYKNFVYKNSKTWIW